MKTTTTTKATHRGVEIVVMSDKIGNQTMFLCTNSRNPDDAEEKWFATQGEAVAHERHVIDKILGPP